MVLESFHTAPMEDHWKFLGRWGLKSQTFRRKYEAKLEFSGGVGVRGWKTKTFHGGSMEIFWNYTILRGMHTLYVINKSEYVILGDIIVYSQSISCDHVIFKFEARVQIYMAFLNICCETQNSGRNVVRFSKINSYKISFQLVLFKNMRNIVYGDIILQLIREFQRYFSRNLQHSIGMLKITN